MRTAKLFASKDLEPYYFQVEGDTGVRKYTEWDDGLKLIDEGFQKIGHPFHPVNAFINEQCDHSGCLFWLPDGSEERNHGHIYCPGNIDGR